MRADKLLAPSLASRSWGDREAQSRERLLFYERSHTGGCHRASIRFRSVDLSCWCVDSLGDAYVCGETWSPDFPAVNAVQAAKHGTSDVFLSELNPQGTALLFSTYIGGSEDQGADNVTLDKAGNVYIAGLTHSGDFPTTPRAFQPGFAGGATDLFIVRVNPANAPGVSFTPAAVTFAPQTVGTTSASQTVIVHNFGSAPLAISKATISGDFAETNNCRSSIAGGGSCAVSIAFTPSATGSRSGALSLTDNAGGSPQKLGLNGTGK